MIATILAFLSNSIVGQIFSSIMSWWSNKEAAAASANAAEQSAESNHQNDGAQSVSDRDSADQQNSALDVIDSPPPPGPSK